MSASDRGKVAEGKVRAQLKDIESKYLRFTFNRISDAHSAGGKGAVSQPGDFQAFYQNEFGARFNFLIEVKETEHEFRLPHGNFSLDAVARMRKRQLAGTECFILTYHSKSKTWRCIEFDFFVHREGGSWDLRVFPLIDMPTTLKENLRID